MTTLLKNLAIAGYRSFGESPQYFENFEKINLFIGQNNAGKSNVLRFISEILGNANNKPKILEDRLARHLPSMPEVLVGSIEEFAMVGTSPKLEKEHRLLKGMPLDSGWSKTMAKLLHAKAKLDELPHAWNFVNVLRPDQSHAPWLAAIQVLSDSELLMLWQAITKRQGGGRRNWASELGQVLIPSLPKHSVVLIPAIRQIGSEGTTSENFDGLGIIDRLAKLQDPDVHSQDARIKFEEITKFVQTVLDSPAIKISIPYKRDTILIHMSGKVLPIESLGSGVHEVIILAAAATVLSNTIVCIEEPEIHLNPVLQKKLLNYLSSKTENQYFITTHSAALMDTKGAEVYHITQKDGTSRVARVTSNRHLSDVCEDLGYRPSDILQANCVIWVEGPSDRIYLKYWLAALKPVLIEGVHYSIMFYGGRLAAHVSNLDLDEEIEDFISLKRLNQRGAILIDSDKASASAPINSTKSRLKKEFDSGVGCAWITQGREVENYIPSNHIISALASVHPNSKHVGGVGKFDNVLTIQSKKLTSQASKVKIAKYITENYQPDLSVHDLKKRLDELIRFISNSNQTQILE
ncbi:AAA family ATPase [Acidovorax sp. Root568]|uniref:AAA family ATPase n=1 Tax=Acidovorax sp. Root568 TaxID=1736565 RepID=UPI0009E71D05|nr:AAA family ATPase [Acidovorax sp. Root568]